MTFSKILATGSYVPSKIVTNDDLAKKVDTSDEWIVKRTGIKRRHFANEQETVVAMAVEAGKQALAQADCKPEAIGMVIVATCTGEQVFPSIACKVQAELNLNLGPAFDVQAACSGFMYAFSIADQFICNQQANKVLVIGSEVMSKVMDWQDRGTCVLFGDGAGAVILEAAEQPGVLATHISADGKQADILYLNNAKMLTDGCLRMDGRAVFKQAVKWLYTAAMQTIEKSNLTIGDIDWLVPHQANIRIIQATVEKLNLSMDKVILTVDQHANTSAASIPLALDFGIKAGKIQRGQQLLLEALGGGLTWGSALVRY